MKANIWKCVALVLALMCILTFPIGVSAASQEAVDWAALLTVPAEEAQREENPEQRMAHNIYSDPDLSATSGKFDGFLIVGDQQSL